MLPAIRRLLSVFRRFSVYADFGGGARQYFLRGAGFGRGQPPWIFNALLALTVLGGIVVFAGKSLGITASAEAPNEAHATASIASFRLAPPASLRAPRPPASSIPVAVERTYPFIWPALGPITSYMNASHPTGIDIGLQSGVDSEIRASAGGIVSFAGGSDYESYGYHVIIDHGQGVSTLYAHLADPLVAAGEPVAQGEVIGIGGSTGKSDGKHLHFEIHIDKTMLDPLDLLPEGELDSEHLDLDCMTAGFVLDAGSSVEFDFVNAILPGGSITNVDLVNGGPSDGAAPQITTRTSTGTTVQIDSAVNLAGPDADDSYNLIVSVEEQGVSHQIDCELTLRTTSALPSYYYRQAAPAPQAQPVSQAVQRVPQATVVTEVPTVVLPPSPTPALSVPANVPILGGGTVEIPAPAATPSPEATDAALKPTRTPIAAMTGSDSTPTPEATATPTPLP